MRKKILIAGALVIAAAAFTAAAIFLWPQKADQNFPDLHYRAKDIEKIRVAVADPDELNMDFDLTVSGEFTLTDPEGIKTALEVIPVMKEHEKYRQLFHTRPALYYFTYHFTDGTQREVPHAVFVADSPDPMEPLWRLEEVRRDMCAVFKYTTDDILSVRVSGVKELGQKDAWGAELTEVISAEITERDEIEYLFSAAHRLFLSEDYFWSPSKNYPNVKWVGVSFFTGTDSNMAVFSLRLTSSTPDLSAIRAKINGIDHVLSEIGIK